MPRLLSDGDKKNRSAARESRRCREANGLLLGSGKRAGYHDVAVDDLGLEGLHLFLQLGADLLGVTRTPEGYDLALLEHLLQTHRPKVFFTQPRLHCPTGASATLAHMYRVLQLAEKYDVLVFEDDPYRDIRFTGHDLAPIKSFDKAGKVILGNSFSKIFSAGSRLGYIVGLDEMMQPLQDVKTAMNSHTSMLPQVLCAEFFKRGYYPEHHEMICSLYRERCQKMMECIEEYFPKGTKWTVPDGGLFTWAQLPGGLNTTVLREEAITRPDVKVAFVAGEKFFTDGEPVTNCMRISFGAVPPENIEKATKKLGKMLCDKLK